MTPTDPAILLVIPVVMLVLVALAAPMEHTERGRRLADRLGTWLFDR